MKRFIISVAAIVLVCNPPTFAALTDGLVAYWSFDATNAVDNSGNGHDGTIHGATPIAGIRGNAYNFNGNGNWIGVARSSAFDLTNNLTIGAWIKYNSIAGVFGSQILWYGDTTPASDPWELHLLPGGTDQFRLDVGTGGVELRLNASNTLSSGTWYFLAATEATVGTLKTLKIYVNGALAGSMVTNAPVSYDLSNMHVEIGSADNGSWQFFNGIIDEPFVYNRALSDQEIGQIYLTGIPEPTTSALMISAVLLLACAFKRRRT